VNTVVGLVMGFPNFRKTHEKWTTSHGFICIQVIFSLDDISIEFHTIYYMQALQF